MRYIGLLALIALFLSCKAVDSNGLSPQSISYDIQKNGAKSVVQKLRSDKKKEWDKVLKFIETGKKEWLAVAKLLREGTDAASSLSLDFAVARALPKTPEAVLEIIDDVFHLNNICTVPFIEADQIVEEKYLKDTELALKNIVNPKLEQRRLQCLSRIHSFRK